MKAISNSVVKVTCMLSIVFLLAGCHTMPTLNYSSVLPSQPSNGVSLNVALNDARAEHTRAVLGGTYNGRQMRMGDVNAPPTLVTDIEQAFQAELENAGYELSNGEGEIDITLTIENILCDLAMPSRCTVEIRAEIVEQGQQVMDYVYEKEAKTSFYVGSPLSDLLQKSTSKVVTEFVQDLDSYIVS